MLDRTEGVALSQVHAPYLRRNMPAFLTIKEKAPSADEVADDRRYSVPMYNHDGLVIRISPNNYHILYDPYTSDWWIQSTGVRRRGLGAYEEVIEQRKRGVEALFEKKERNEWMKGIEEAEIERTKDTFQRWIKHGPVALERGSAVEAAPVAGIDGASDTIMSGTG